MATVLNGSRGGEVITRLAQVRAITELPAYQQVLERHYEQLAAIDGEPFIDAEKKRRKALVQEQTTSDLERTLERAVAERSREFEQQEGQARAAARGDQWVSGPALPTDEEKRREERQFRRDQALTSEWALVLATVPTITDMATLERLAEDAQLVNHPRIYRAAMQAITQQTGRLAAAERRKTPAGPMGRVHVAHSMLSSSYAAWLKANPTPAERLRQIADARTRHESELQRSALTYRQAYGLESVS